MLDEMVLLLGLTCFILSESILKKMQAFKNLFKAVKIVGESVYLNVLEIHRHSTALDLNVVIVVANQHSLFLCMLS